MKTISQLYEGVSNELVFNFDQDSESDIILLNTGLKKSDMFDSVFHFSYEFTDKASSSDRTKFFNEFRFGANISKTDSNRFISTAISRLDKEIDLRKFDAIVLPRSRSEINSRMLKFITRTSRIKPFSFELVKKQTSDINFDIDRFTDEVLNSTVMMGSKERPRYTDKQKSEALQKMKNIIDSVRKSDYFSIAESIKTNKLKEYVEEFLEFENEESKNTYEKLKDKNILVIDDVTTTGSTIIEIIKTLQAVNRSNKIVIFSLIGKPNLM
ncbi:gp114 [Sphingomonas phage PAU]|uniref:gp114 n=1 Tax=Sphingomonas phage PAU TaxID=1150991 RepID=UPI0002573265|nr:gp114 [Sphingomonas phage PAU]AFF28112.1 gp114 [Sphingomonas phage PAU]